MTWNYRVIDLTEQSGNGELLYGIVEAYYDAHGNPNLYSDPFIIAENLNDLHQELLNMFEAIQKPTLNPKDFLRSSGDEHEEGFNIT
jgi:hypothetical protein